jgi:hypothetical protein
VYRYTEAACRHVIVFWQVPTGRLVANAQGKCCSTRESILWERLKREDNINMDRRNVFPGSVKG